MPRPLSPDEIFPAGSADITQRFITLPSGMRVRVDECGPASGAPVVMVPGWGGAVYMFRHAFDPLARRGLRAIAMDPRGFGLSDKPSARGDYSLDAYLDDLLGLFDALGIQ